MSSTYGEKLKLSIFGQSHGAAIGMTLDGIPAGLPVDYNELQQFLNRRAPGQHEYATSRREEDVPEFLGGIVNGYTCGAPIAAMIRNRNTKSNDYSELKTCPRPGHADYTAQVKYNGFQDYAGGGHFSGRLTAALCIAGGLCKQWLAANNIHIAAHIYSIASATDEDVGANWNNPELKKINDDFPVFNKASGKKMREIIAQAKENNDSVGGVIECFVTGLPVGLGEPMFGGMESKIAQIVYGIPAVKGLEFGAGFASTRMYGSENNDAFQVVDGSITQTTNNCGGILGGITSGAPLVFRTAIKPTPSIAKPQQSINMNSMESQTLQITGRHDPCIVPRAVPVVEAAAAIAIYDALLLAGGK